MEKNNTLKKELSNCSPVKALLMLMVIFGHSIAFWTGTWFTQNPVYKSLVLDYMTRWIGDTHIGCFTLVSGYIFYYVKHERGGYKEFWPFILNKTKRLLIPYCFAMIVWVCPITCVLRGYGIRRVLVNFALGTSPGQLWFLLMLFIVFVIMWILDKVLYKNITIGVLLSLGSYIVGLFGSHVIPNVFQIWTAFQYVPLFYLGYRLREDSDSIIRRIPWYIWLCSYTVLFVAFQILSDRGFAQEGWLSQIITFILQINGSLMAFNVLQMVISKVEWQQSKMFSILSNNSMPMYLFHQQIIYFTIIWLNGKVNPWINVGVNYIVANALENHKNACWRKMILNKKRKRGKK